MEESAARQLASDASIVLGANGRIYSRTPKIHSGVAMNGNHRLDTTDDECDPDNPTPGCSSGGTSSGGTTSTGGTSSGGTTSTGGTSSGGTTSTGGTSSGGTTSTGGTSSGGTTCDPSDCSCTNSCPVDAVSVSISPGFESVADGGTAVFNADAFDDFGDPIDYQWYLNGTPVGFDSSELVLNNVDYSLNGSTIQVVVSVPATGASASDTAGLGVQAPVQSTPAISIQDTSTGATASSNGSPYTGPFTGGLVSQYIWASNDSVNVTVNAPNFYVVTGAGDDAVALYGGVNVVDAGGGSNFLTSGSGIDTFFVNMTSPVDVWDTIVNFHSGDAVTCWGVTPNGNSFDWENSQGAPGYQGLTLHITAPGQPTGSITLTGFGSADLSNGNLSTTFGAAGGLSYLYIQAN